MPGNDLGDKVDKDLCKVLHKQVDDKFKEHDEKLSDHDKNLDLLNRSDAKKDTQIDTLCKQMGGLTKAIWGLVSMVAVSLLGFFFYAVQNHLFAGK